MVTTAVSPTPRDEIISSLEEQTEDLCHIHDHITRIITNLDIGEDWFTGYDEPGRAKFDLEPMVRLFLYKYTRDFSQSELARRLRGAAYVYLRLGFDSPVSQQIISHNERNRFNATERRILKDAADRIADVCAEHDIISVNEPALEPEDVQHEQVSEEHIMEAVKRATDLGFSEFTANRASNAKYALEAYFERQGYLNMARAGATSKRRRFARLSERDEVPHGSSHNRTMKKVATPDEQLSFEEFVNGKPRPEWKRIRDTVLEPFHAGVENILDEITDDERDSVGFREPVHAAIDITTWNFWPSPFKPEEEATPEEEPVTYTVKQNGKKVEKTKYLKEGHPEMTSGFKNSDERGYKFATITIIAADTPIVLGVEPVRDKRRWEDAEEVETTSRGDIVARLLEQAEQHVDIHKVFLDRGFDSMQVRDMIDQHPSLYILGKKKNAKVDKEKIEEIKEDEIYDGRVVWGSLEYEGRVHDISYIYHPTDEDGENYTIFTVNAHVSTDRAQALIRQYNQRMEIENQYKSIKEHFLPKTCSSDYRPRFLYFVIGVVMYNVWRSANFVLRDEVNVNLGETPPIAAGEIIELIGFCLFDPGG